MASNYGIVLATVDFGPKSSCEALTVWYAAENEEGK